MSDANPVIVEFVRGDRPESRHRGAAVVVDVDGSRVATYGDVDQPVFPRSTVKPLQALPLLETGTAERFSVSDEEIALACGSHSGDAEHVQRVGAWLARMGQTPDVLVCGPHPPISEDANRDLIRRGEQPSRLHNNCSAKHVGFVATALHLREPVMGYAGPVHPVQLRVKRVLSQMAAVELTDDARAVDGCGVPTLAMPLTALATSIARLAAPDRLGRLRSQALRRIITAMTSHPSLVSGQGRFDAVIMQAAEGGVIVKSGAEGVHVAVLLQQGLGIALKIDDGAKRAAEPAMAALLAQFARPDERLKQVLLRYPAAPIRNTTGARVGTVRVRLDPQRSRS